MTTVNIIIPVTAETYETVNSYYKDILRFEENEGLFFLPIPNKTVGLLLMYARSDSVILPPDSRRLPMFSFHIERDFPTYCTELYKRGAVFDMACNHRGGYYARIIDPLGNPFEIWCDSEEDEAGTDPFELPFFYTID
ncbi:hypothetical protein [Massilia sp. METH4]|uniref:hypothetical protein n=1 Tax=Massilia sp. METH4 TaxID=3123041 RepID=UPI0030D47A1E